MLESRLSRIASAFAGYSVKVFVNVPRENCDGHLALTVWENDEVQIRLSDDLSRDDDLYLRAFVHEVAHCVYRHWRPLDDGESLAECLRRREVEAKVWARRLGEYLSLWTTEDAIEELERLVGPG